MDNLSNDGLNPVNVDFFAETGSFQGAPGGTGAMRIDTGLGGGGEKPKIVHPPKEGFRQEVSTEDFHRTNTRIQKARRIAHDLKPSDGKPYSRERVDELRDIEMRSEQGDEAKRTGLEEMVLDTRGYQPLRFKMHYTDQQGQTITEELVGFTKQEENGETEYLRFPDGRAVALNASLYITRLGSHKHAQGIDYDTKMIPRVDGRGAYTGIVSIIEDKGAMPPFSSLQELAQSGNERVYGSSFDGTRIRQELEKPMKPSDLPGAQVLAAQLDRNQADILRKAPNAPHQQVAFNLASRFYNMSLYQRISEQAMFGPKDYERFDDPNKLAPLLPQIRKDLADAEQTIATNRPNAKIIQENGWLYVDQGKHKTDYRIYLSPDPKAIGKVFSDLAITMPESVRYQMKTFDNPTHALEASRLDKIIVYCPESDFDAILSTVEKVYQQNQASFQDRPAPGGGVVVPAEGISITKQPEKDANGKEVTGTQQVADTIEKTLQQKLPQITKDRLGKYKDAMQASQSDEGKTLWSVMQLDQEHMSRFWYAGNEPLNDTQKNALTTAYLRSLWGATLYNYAEGKPISANQLRQNFLKAIQGQVQLTPNQMQHLVTAKMSEFQDQSINDRLARAALKTGLAIALDDGLVKGQAPGATFQQLLAA